MKYFKAIWNYNYCGVSSLSLLCVSLDWTEIEKGGNHEELPQLNLESSNDLLETPHMIKWLSHAYGITLGSIGFQRGGGKELIKRVVWLNLKEQKQKDKKVETKKDKFKYE